MTMVSRSFFFLFVLPFQLVFCQHSAIQVQSPPSLPSEKQLEETDPFPNLFKIGLFVSPKTASERVVIPDPPTDPTPSGLYCPHQDDDLIDWRTLSLSLWGGSAPPTGTSGDVTLPENTRVIIRESIHAILGVVTIPLSSELIFDESNLPIDFSVHGIDVQGKLTIGSESCHVHTPITITLHGHRPHDVVTNVPRPTYKGISVTGELSLHGARFAATWTRLSFSIIPGDTQILLQHNVNWEPGQEIVLVTTAMKDSREWHRNEVAIIKSVEQNPLVTNVGAIVHLEAPVKYPHIAIAESYQGEVGLLTRSIKIQGDIHSEPTDPDPLNCTFGNYGERITNNYGDRQRPCPNKELTGFGGHIIVHGMSGRAYVEGVELYRMGQTNILGRYPMHFHLLGDCPECYFRHSSVHRSFYRCISIHGTNYAQVAQNVGYDVTGFCYYLEDGVEHHNRIEFNLGAFIHMLGPEPPRGLGQNTPTYVANEQLTLPADVAASAFYISNVHNFVVGNAASGGWAGFAFPNLPRPLGQHRNVQMRPSSVTQLEIDGNTAHSTGWWWDHAAAFYFGGTLYYNSDGILEYNAGRDKPNRRQTCHVNKCAGSNNCGAYCRSWEQGWLRVTNSKAFLVAGAGLGSWSGRIEILGYECHDCGKVIEAISEACWIDNMAGVCRTQTPIALPEDAKASLIPGGGFTWYDTSQEHIITNATFRNCGYRSDQYNQYDQAPSRGCGDEDDIGCTADSSIWTFITHSDYNVPESMQATKSIKIENSGRRFRFKDFRKNQPSSVSGRVQNWVDADGSVTGFGVPSVIASGLSDAGMWWQVDDEVVYDEQGPLYFYKQQSGRGIGHMNLIWDERLEGQNMVSQCGNGKDIDCDYIGYVKHLGDYYRHDPGLPITANADIAGPVGGFGWKVELDGGPPKSLMFQEVEADPETPMLVSIAYPVGTTFNITYHARYCTESEEYTCSADMYQVDSIADVRNSLGNAYHVDWNGVLTIRIIQTAKNHVGKPDFYLPSYSDLGKRGLGFALERFERNGIRLPQFVDGTYIKLDADCPSNDGVYCSEIPPPYNPQVCPTGSIQSAFDACTGI